MSKPERNDMLFGLDMSKPLRDKDGLSWGDKRDKIILACLGLPLSRPEAGVEPPTGPDRHYGKVKSYPQAGRGQGPK